MSNLLRVRPVATVEMMAAWDDAATIRHALAFEAALATAEAAEGLMIAATADAIEGACAQIIVDPATLAEEVALAGTLAIPLVEALRAAVPEWARNDVHRSATSQDVADTVLMLQVSHAWPLLRGDVDRIVDALAIRARETASLPAMGRTLMQDARPVGFGLRLAHWRSGIRDARQRLDGEIGRGACLQFGGAVGTRAGLEGHGAEISRRMAEELGLRSAASWHARRDATAGMAAALGILIGAIAKMARDVALLAQTAIAEAHEPLTTGRGGSSAMPGKRNPAGCQVALSAATRAPGLVAAILSGMAGEAERGVGGWQAEAPVIADLFLLASGSAAAMAEVAEGLDIDTDAIGRNLGGNAGDVDIGESVALVATLLED